MPPKLGADRVGGRTPLLSAAAGAAAGAVAYLLVSVWLVAVAVAAVYAPLAYLCLRDPGAVAGRLLRDGAPRGVRLAQTCGVFGIGVGIGLFAAQMRPRTLSLAFGLWAAGAAALLAALPTSDGRRPR